MEFKNIESLSRCNCGREHSVGDKCILIGKGAVERLPEKLKEMGTKKAFLLADVNTYAVLGEKIEALLEKSGISYTRYIFPEEHLEPDERAVGSAVMHYDMSCDTVLSVGSGVINDIGKIVANVAGTHYAIVATAPSMDGYASATSSMAMGGVKVTLPSRCAQLIVGDTDILKNAPLPMLKAGLGDMLAKYVSLCEWRIAHIITGEYYCETVASMVRDALQKCVGAAPKLLLRDEGAVEAVFEGLVLTGEAMRLAGTSRPASGVEHYFSHVWDMRALEFGTASDLHGIQCAIGTLWAVRLYERLKKIAPEKERALRYAKEFDFSGWCDALRHFLGKGAEPMIAAEAVDGKYRLDKHAARLQIILERWEQILRVIDEELPRVEYLENLFQQLELPREPEEIGIAREILPMTLGATKDIRDKYVLSRLLWDLGLLEEMM